MLLCFYTTCSWLACSYSTPKNSKTKTSHKLQDFSPAKKKRYTKYSRSSTVMMALDERPPLQQAKLSRLGTLMDRLQFLSGK